MPFSPKVGFSWDEMVIKTIERYFITKLDLSALPRTPEKIIAVYSAMQDLEFLAQSRIQLGNEQLQQNYSSKRISEKEIKTYELGGDFTDCINRFHSWGLALEPFFRKLQSAEKIVLDMETGREANE